MVALTPDGKELWAYGCHSPFIAIIDTTRPDYPVVGTVQIPGDHRAPISQIIFSSDGRYAYMTNSSYLFSQEPFSGTIEINSQILIIDVVSRCVSAIIKTDPIYLGTFQGSLVLSPDGATLMMSAFNGSYPNDNGILRLDLRTNRLIGFTRVPGLSSFVLSADGRYLYCTTGSPTPGLLSIVDTQTWQIKRSITVGKEPTGVALTPDGSKAGVTNFESGSVSLVDLSSMTVIKTIMLGLQPNGIAASPDGKKMYVGTFRPISSDLSGNEISVIDIESDALKKYIVTGPEPQRLVMHPDGTRLFVSCGNANGQRPAMAHVIDVVNDIYIQPIILRESAQFAPTGIETTPDGKRLFVISEARQSLLTIDVSTKSLISEQAIHPRALKVSQDGKRLFVFSPHYPAINQGKLLVLDTHSLQILDSIDLGDTETGVWWDTTVDRIVLDSKEKTAYLTAGDIVHVIIVDLVGRKVKEKIPVGTLFANFRSMALTPDDRLLFVGDNPSRRVVVIDASTYSAIASITMDDQPRGIQVSGNGERAYVFQQITGRLSTIDANSLAITRNVDIPYGIGQYSDFLLSADERYAIVMCFDPNWIAVFEIQEANPDMRIKTLSYSGLDPLGCVASADRKLLFATNFSSDTISVFDMVSMKIIDTIAIGDAYNNLADVFAGNAMQLPARTVAITFWTGSLSSTGDVNCDRKVNAIDLMMLNLKQNGVGTY